MRNYVDKKKIIDFPKNHLLIFDIMSDTGSDSSCVEGDKLSGTWSPASFWELFFQGLGESFFSVTFRTSSVLFLKLF